MTHPPIGRAACRVGFKTRDLPPHPDLSLGKGNKGQKIIYQCSSSNPTGAATRRGRVGRTSDGASFRHAGANELQNSPHKPAPTGLEARRRPQLADGEGCGRRTLREGPRCKHCWWQRRRRNKRRKWPQSPRQRSVSCKLAVCDIVGSALVASHRTATDAHLVSAAAPPTPPRPTPPPSAAQPVRLVKQPTHPPARF